MHLKYAKEMTTITVQLKFFFSIFLPSQWVIKLSGRIKKIYPSEIPPILVETLP